MVYMATHTTVDVIIETLSEMQVKAMKEKLKIKELRGGVK